MTRVMTTLPRGCVNLADDLIQFKGKKISGWNVLTGTKADRISTTKVKCDGQYEHLFTIRAGECLLKG
jgi:hypothetical protein